MTEIEVPESYTDHDAGEFSAVNVRVVATWSAQFSQGLPFDFAASAASWIAIGPPPTLNNSVPQRDSSYLSVPMNVEPPLTHREPSPYRRRARR